MRTTQQLLDVMQPLLADESRKTARFLLNELEKEGLIERVEGGWDVTEHFHVRYGAAFSLLDEMLFAEEATVS